MTIKNAKKVLAERKEFSALYTVQDIANKLGVKRTCIDNLLHRYRISGVKKDSLGVKYFSETSVKLITQLLQSRVVGVCLKEEKPKEEDDLRLMGLNEVSCLLGISPRTAIRALNSGRNFPKPIMLSGARKWSRESIRNWISESQK